MKRIAVLSVLVLVAAGFALTQLAAPPIQTHTLIDGQPCIWILDCGPNPVSAAGMAGRAGILIGMVLATVLALQFVLKKLAHRR